MGSNPRGSGCRGDPRNVAVRRRPCCSEGKENHRPRTIRRRIPFLIRVSPVGDTLVACYNLVMFYTGKGDKGQTKLYHCNQSLSKSSAIAEALGAVDEINSFIGWCKTQSEVKYVIIDRQNLSAILGEIQNSLFSVQAELAGAPKILAKTAVKKAESLINQIEKELPPVKSFIVTGGVSLSAMLDVARTLARRAERRVVMVAEEGEIKLQSSTLAYLNRLSSLLYALARLVNHRAGVDYQAPTYR